MSTTRDTLYLYIEAERLRQDQKWGEQNHDNFIWGSVLGEEVGEVCKAVNEDSSPLELREELIQVAAVAIAWVEAIERRVPAR